jgi:hypothetical protein
MCLVAGEIGALFFEAHLPMPRVIGNLIRVLLLFQAAFCFAFGTSLPALVCGVSLLLLFPVSRLAARRFYAS